VEFHSDLSLADQSLYSFFLKIGRDRVTPETHAWIKSLARATREIYDNTLNHAFYATRAPQSYKDSDPDHTRRANFWFFGFRRFVYNKTSEYIGDLPHFGEFLGSFSSKIRHFICINITDDGPGLVDYYNASTFSGDEVRHVSEIIERNLSSTGISGAGMGLTNAATEVFRHKGYFLVSSAQQYYCQLYVENAPPSRRVGTLPHRLGGTSVDILIPILEQSRR
jgi:hypothetical protein